MQHYSNSVFFFLPSPTRIVTRHGSFTNERTNERMNGRVHKKKIDGKVSLGDSENSFKEDTEKKRLLDSLSVWYRWLIKLQRECYYSAFVLLHLKTALNVPKSQSVFVTMCCTLPVHTRINTSSASLTRCFSSSHASRTWVRTAYYFI